MKQFYRRFLALLLTAVMTLSGGAVYLTADEAAEPYAEELFIEDEEAEVYIEPDFYEEDEDVYFEYEDEDEDTADGEEAAPEETSEYAEETVFDEETVGEEPEEVFTEEPDAAEETAEEVTEEAPAEEAPAEDVPAVEAEEEETEEDEAEKPVLESRVFDLGVSGLSVSGDPEQAGALVVTYDGTEYENVPSEGEIVLTGTTVGNSVSIDAEGPLAVRLENLSVDSSATCIRLSGSGETTVTVAGRNTLRSDNGAIVVSGGRSVKLVRASEGGYLYAYSTSGSAISAGDIALDVPTAAAGGQGSAGISGNITILNENINASLKGAHLYRAGVSGLAENAVLSGSVTVDGADCTLGEGLYTVMDGAVAFHVPAGHVEAVLDDVSYEGDVTDGDIELAVKEESEEAVIGDGEEEIAVEETEETEEAVSVAEEAEEAAEEETEEPAVVEEAGEETVEEAVEEASEEVTLDEEEADQEEEEEISVEEAAEEDAAETGLTGEEDEELAGAPETDGEESASEDTVYGVRDGYNNVFEASLDGVQITVTAPYFAYGSGVTMTASLADAQDFAEAVERQNYGKKVSGIAAVSLSFRDRFGRKVVSLLPMTVTLRLEGVEAEEYALYENYRYFLYPVGGSSDGRFSFRTTMLNTYVMAGLADDGKVRATGRTRNGRMLFTLKDGGADISVSAPKDAFSGTVTLEAETKAAEEVAGAVDGLLENSENVESIQAVDISFNSAGEEVEPSREVTVTMAADLSGEGTYRLVHIADDGTAEFVDNAKFGNGTVTFTSKEFSVYAVVEIAASGALDFEMAIGGATVRVKAPEGAFEPGTTMVLQSVDPEELLKVVTALGSDKTYSFNAIDISFIKDGEEVEPSLPVDVTWMSSAIDANDENLVHLKDDGTVETLEDAVISENKVEFTADSFSTYTTVRLDTFELGSNVVFEPEALRNDPSVTLPTTMNSGDLSETHPEFEGYTYVDATYQKGSAAASPDKVVYLGAFIYREFDDSGAQIGNDVTYIYYKTEDTVDDSDLIVKLAEDETIHLNYEKTPYKVTYKVVYNGREYVIGTDTLPAELEDLVVKGPDAVAENTTYEQAVTVSLPRGYSARVSMSNRSGYEDPQLGAYSEPTYVSNDGWTVVPDENSFTIEGLYTISGVTSDLTVTVDLSKRNSYTFNATPAFSTEYFGRGSRYTTSDQTRTTFTGNEHTFTFTTAYVASGRYQWVMDSFNINKETINVPYVNTNHRTASATTVLQSGTIINLSAVFHPNNNTRTYTVSISNCYENISFTGGNLHGSGDHDEWVVQETLNLAEFDYLASSWLPLKPGEPMTFAVYSDGYYEAGTGPNPTAAATHYYWSGGFANYRYYEAGYYPAGNRPDRNAPATHYQYSGTAYRDRVIRFKVAEGYVNPKVKYITQEETDQYNRVFGITLDSEADENQYHLVTSEPDADGYYYFALRGTQTDPGLLSVRAELARYGVSYAPGTVTGAEIPDYDYGGFYGDGTLQGYNIIDNQYVVVDKSAPVDPANEYIFLYYKIDGDDSGDTYAPSQKIPLKSIADFASYDEDKEEYVIPLTAYWEKKEESKLVTVVADIYLDDELEDTVNTNVPEKSAIYIDIDSQTMTDVMEKYNWQLFYDEMNSDPFIENVTEENSHVEIRLYSKFYVYHTGTGKLELHTAKEAETGEGDNRKIGTIDFSAYADGDFLYGGYYSAYADGSDVQTAMEYNNDEGTLTTREIQSLSNKGSVALSKESGGKQQLITGEGTTVDAPIYNPQPGDTSWNWDDAYTAKEGKPVRAQIYYIKEVPTGFLQNYVFYVYDRNSRELASLYPMTATDDGNYEDIGVTFDSDATTSEFGSRYKFCKSIKFSNSNPEVATHILSATDNYKVSGTLTENVFSDRDVHKGYLAIWKNKSESFAAEKNKSFTVHPYWETPDHVTVEGIHTSTINTGADASAETITIVNN